MSLEAWSRALRAYGRDDDSLSRLALITNGASDSQHDALRTLGIEQLFRPVVISAEIGIAKPDPAIFAIAIDKVGLKPEHVSRTKTILCQTMRFYPCGSSRACYARACSRSRYTPWQVWFA